MVHLYWYNPSGTAAIMPDARSNVPDNAAAQGQTLDRCSRARYSPKNNRRLCASRFVVYAFALAFMPISQYARFRKSPAPSIGDSAIRLTMARCCLKGKDTFHVVAASLDAKSIDQLVNRRVVHLIGDQDGCEQARIVYRDAGPVRFA